MRSLVLVLTLVTVVSAAPFVISSNDHREEHVTTRFLASREAQEIASTDFVLVAASISGCATNISHDEVSNVPDGESPVVEGIVTFANIKVNGQTCGTGADDEIMNLFSYHLLDSILPGGAIDLSAEAQRAIIVGGMDLAVRRCGTWEEEFEQRYAFSSDITSLLTSLSENGLIDNSTISETMLNEDVAWMVSAPQDGPGRVCLYKQVVDGDGQSPDPTATPDAEEVVSEGSSDTDEGSSGTAEETSAADPDRPEDNNSDEDKSKEKQTIFEGANEAALELEEQDADEEPACFPGSAQVYLEDGSVKTMAELEIGDKVMVAPNVFSEVFMFTHRLHDGDYKFMRIATDSGNTLSVTAGHYIYINGRPMIAEKASVGDFLELADGRRAAVVSVSSVMDRGLYNPQTLEGDITVNSIRASTYTNALEPSTAHAVLAPLRALFSQLHFRTAYFDGGADSLVRMIPMGRALP